MHRHMRAMLGLLLAGALAAGCSGAKAPGAVGAAAEARPVPGAPAPAVTATDVFTGKTVTLADLRGHVVLLNFWATWCKPCRLEMPDLQKLYGEMGDRVSILAVGGDSNESKEALAGFAKEMQLTFPIAWDKGDAAQRYQILGLPTTFLIDQNGVVRNKHLGSLTLADMRTLVAQTEEAGRKQQ